MRGWLALLIICLVAVGGEARGEDGEGGSGSESKATVRGYVDKDRDGVNDLFADANGDGVDDVSGEPYPHRFGFADVDEDGVNDLFVDADGDGVNDRDGSFTDRDEDGTCDNVIDHDRDGVNDITGAKYTEKSLQGERYGRVDESRGLTHRRFVDEDGDGMHDLRPTGPGGPRTGMDQFVDEDGDGIHDGRTIRGRNAPMEPRGREQRGQRHGREDEEGEGQQHRRGQQ